MSELSRETSALLDHGRDDESFQAVDKARLKRALLAQVAGVSVAATSGTGSAWAMTVSTASKVLSVVAIAATVTGGVMMVAFPKRPAPSSDTRAPMTHALSTKPDRNGPALIAASASPPPSALLQKTPTPPSAATILERPVTAAHASPPSPTPAPFTSSLETEAATLGHADDALKAGDPDQALSILRDLSARFPASDLTPERTAELVFALCLAGRVDEARAAREEFDALKQTGPLAARVHASCAKP
jgi:hypothetical protein